MEIRRKYGTAATIYFPLIDAGTTDFESTPVSPAGAEVQVIIDGATPANANNTVTHEGNGIYSLALDAAELQGEVIVVTLIDASGTKLWDDQAIIITTSGDASALEEFDFDAAQASGPEIAAAILDRVYTTHNTANTLGEFLNAVVGSDAKALISTDAQDLSASLDVNTKSFDANAINSSALATSAVNEIVNAIFAKVISEPGSVPALGTDDFESVIEWLAAYFLHSLEQTATIHRVKNAAGSGNLGTATISDDGTKFTRGKYS